MSRTLALDLNSPRLRIAQSHRAGERFATARRHARLALANDPQSATAWLELGRAWEDDPYGSDERAAKCYRKAVRLDRSDAVAFALLARASVRTNRDTLAKTAMARAMKLAPADAAALAVILEACREAGWMKRAWRLVCQARFAAPRDAAIRSLWNRCRFDRAVDEQKDVAKPDRGLVLPFLRIAAM